MTFHPTTAAELKAAIEDPAGPSVIDCDVLKDSYGTSSANIGRVSFPDRHLEIAGRQLRLWTNDPAGAAIYDGDPQVGDIGLRLRDLRWGTNGAVGFDGVNVDGLEAEGVEFYGADTGWHLRRAEGGQVERVQLYGCAASTIKYDCILFTGGSFNATRIEAFKGHHHQNPDDGATAYMARIESGSLYGSKFDLYGWQDDKENPPDNNKGMKVHAAGNISRSNINIDLENGGFYLMKVEFPNPSFPWEGPHNRQLVALDFDQIHLSGTWPYAYGFILDGGPTAPTQMPTNVLEDWIRPERIVVTGGHFVGYGKEHNRVVGIAADGSTLYPSWTVG